ncbi:TniB family NTP-binding protein [Sphingomonas sp.]|uniref:TniB family NTP-binding protein n=1 Tax=Sphingomonas sp. TaxID=28214 RepID=UPI001EB48A19|nr:TniB family NTP-binding protein [Sphingomonas sp.]MBX3595067.1 TniB family NTP-binding protein [Sphingomonas sp.]
MLRKSPKAKVIPTFANQELIPSTGSPVEDLSLATARVTAAKIVDFDQIYLQHPAHRRLFAQFDYLRQVCKAPGPKRAIRVVGPSSAGKSTAIGEYQQIVARRGDAEQGAVPLLSVKLDRACTTKRLMTSILDEYGDEYSEASVESTLRKRVYLCIERLKTELIFVDEVQHLNFRASERSDPTDTLKRMLDDGVVGLVFAGDPTALPLLSRNIQLANRMIAPCDLMPLEFGKPEDNATFKSFVQRLDAAMVERRITARSSGFDDPRTLRCMFIVSAGLLGRVVNLVRAALEVSTRRGADFVEPHDLSRAVRDWAMPQLICKYDPFSAGVVGG